ncbi:iron-containing alcohol dehydrogenase [Escherichia coli]
MGYGHDLAAPTRRWFSCMAGMAFSSAGLGLCHAMAHQPGAALHIPHGKRTPRRCRPCGFNRMDGRERFSQIAAAPRP